MRAYYVEVVYKTIVMLEAESEEHAKEIVKEIFTQEHSIDLVDEEITVEE